MLGPIEQPLMCGHRQHIIAGACHPLLMDKVGQSDRGTSVRIKRGYPRSAYLKPGPPEGAMTGELRAELAELSADVEVSVDPCVGGGPISLKPPVGVAVKVHPERLAALTKDRQQNAREPAPALDASQFVETRRWSVWPAAMEFVADAGRWDPLGSIWGRGAHWPLFVSIGARRERTKSSVSRKKEKRKTARAPGAAQPCVGEAAHQPGGGRDDVWRNREDRWNRDGWRYFGDAGWWWYDDFNSTWFDQDWNPWLARA